jgi:hypothetical protein
VTETLLATDADQSKDATTPQGGVTDVDKAPAPQVADETTDEPKTTEPKAEPKAGEAKPEDTAPKAPEHYEKFVTPKAMPEGFELDDAVTESLHTVSRELDLTQEQAQKVVTSVWPVLLRRAEEQQAELHDKWAAEAKADKEYGGKNFDDNIAKAIRAQEVLGSDGLREFLDETGLGDHPEMVRFFVKVGQLVSEDSFVGGVKGGKSVDLNDEAAVANVLYPKSHMQTS